MFKFFFIFYKIKNKIKNKIMTLILDHFEKKRNQVFLKDKTINGFMFVTAKWCYFCKKMKGELLKL